MSPGVVLMSHRALLVSLPLQAAAQSKKEQDQIDRLHKDMGKVPLDNPNAAATGTSRHPVPLIH